MTLVSTKIKSKAGLLNNNPIHLTHKNLVEQSKRNDRKAQYTLYNQYVDAMFQISLRMLNNRNDAEDVVQESFVKAFKNLAYFKYESSFGAWLKKIVINNCINHLKKRKVSWISLEEASFKTPIIEPESMELSKDQMPKLNQIKTAISKLPDGFRVVLTLYLLEGYDHREISEILNIAESTSKTQYHRAKIKLKELVKTM